jgi:aminomethyltransferase
MSNDRHFDRNGTVRIASRRFERSPFQDRWETPDTVFSVYAGRYCAAFNGEDVEATYWALRRKAVLYDVPERPVEISGPDAERFLERIFARRVHSLRERRGRYAIACTPQGRVFMDGILFRMATDRFWYVQPDGALETWLLAHSEGFNVSITDPRSRVLQIQGPTSFAIMKGGTRDAHLRVEVPAECAGVPMVNRGGAISSRVRDGGCLVPLPECRRGLCQV